MEDRSQFGDQTPDIVTHERTYHAFSVLVRWCMVLLATSILFLTLWFATGAGFWGGLVVGLVAFVVGYYFVIKHEEKQPLDIWVDGR